MPGLGAFTLVRTRQMSVLADRPSREQPLSAGGPEVDYSTDRGRHPLEWNRWCIEMTIYGTALTLWLVFLSIWIIKQWLSRY
jgi:hypothetical protein